MKILAIRPSLLNLSNFDKEDIFLVIDTFRATTTLAVLAGTGVETIFIVENHLKAQLLKRKECSECLLIGEAGGLKIKDFDYGNSPFTLYGKNLQNQRVIFTSSNGAKTLLLLKGMKNIFLGALVNLSIISEKLSELATKEDKNVIIIPAGKHGDPGKYVLEDWITCILTAQKISQLSDIPIAVEDVFWNKTVSILEEKSNLEELLLNSPNGANLTKLGFETDVIFSSTIDKISDFLKVKKWLKIGEYNYVVLE